MGEDHWRARHVTDSAQRILRQIPDRAHDRGLHAPGAPAVALLALWALLLWERKVGLAALERMGVRRFKLARGLDRLLEGQAEDNPVVAVGARRFWPEPA